MATYLGTLCELPAKLETQGDGRVRFWSLGKADVGSIQYGGAIRTDSVRSMAIVDGSQGFAAQLLTGHPDGNVRVWRLEDLQLLQTIAAFEEAVFTMRVVPGTYSEQGRVVVPAEGLKVFEWRMDKWEETIHVPDQNHILCLALLPDSRLVSAHVGCQLVMWSTADWTELAARADAHAHAVWAVVSVSGSRS